MKMPINGKHYVLGNDIEGKPASSSSSYYYYYSSLLWPRCVSLFFHFSFSSFFFSSFLLCIDAELCDRIPCLAI